MAISIPDASKIRITTGTNDPDNGQLIPCVAGAAIAGPVPVAVSSTGANSAGQAQVVTAQEAQAGKGVANYLGFCFNHSRAAGQACSVGRGLIVEGFAGVTPGGPVYIDSAAAGGLTHTAPEGITTRIGVGMTSTKIRFD